jgi:segregation and condensation protein B
MEPGALKSTVESILFVANRPLRVKDLATMLEQQEFAVQSAIDQLRDEHLQSGIVLLENNGWYQLSTNPANSTAIKNFLNADLREKLTDATVEVLAIIAYRQPISKAEIEAIRGVNSQYSIRHLLMRGLIEKIPNPHDARGFLYETTTEFLQHLGLTSVKDLPEFDKLIKDIKLPETLASNELQQEQIPETFNSTEKNSSQSSKSVSEAIETLEESEQADEQ